MNYEEALKVLDVCKKMGFDAFRDLLLDNSPDGWVVIIQGNSRKIEV